MVFSSSPFASEPSLSTAAASLLSSASTHGSLSMVSRRADDDGAESALLASALPLSLSTGANRLIALLARERSRAAFQRGSGKRPHELGEGLSASDEGEDGCSALPASASLLSLSTGPNRLTASTARTPRPAASHAAQCGAIRVGDRRVAERDSLAFFECLEDVTLDRCASIARVTNEGVRAGFGALPLVSASTCASNPAPLSAAVGEVIVSLSGELGVDGCSSRPREGGGDTSSGSFFGVDVRSLPRRQLRLPITEAPQEGKRDGNAPC